MDTRHLSVVVFILPSGDNLGVANSLHFYERQTSFCRGVYSSLWHQLRGGHLFAFEMDTTHLSVVVFILPSGVNLGMVFAFLLNVRHLSVMVFILRSCVNLGVSISLHLRWTLDIFLSWCSFFDLVST